MEISKSKKMSASKEESSQILQPISVNSLLENVDSPNNEKSGDMIPCLLCEETFPADENGSKSPMLAHLLSIHKLVISEVEKIASFPSYVRYWKKKFEAATELTEYCVVIKTNTAPGDKAPQENFYMLTSFLKEDKILRDKLNTEKLSKMLDEQQLERQDRNFSRRCLFCKVMFHGNRAEIFLHMAKDHAFNVGNPDNIVHAPEFIDLIKSKLDSFTCLFCEKQFKDWNILKDHMRKKAHKRLNPENKEYDQYYLINYLDPGKDWKEVQLEPEYEKENIPEDGEEDTEKEWDDWVEENKLVSLCLFCNKTDQDVYNILSHMKNDHSFDLHSLQEKHKLNFYHQVKIVNYIRKQIYQNKCPKCLQAFPAKDKLRLHLSEENHYDLPEERGVWDQPGYFFPTFDDDTLLCFIDVNDNSSDEDDDDDDDDVGNIHGGEKDEKGMAKTPLEDENQNIKDFSQLNGKKQHVNGNETNKEKDAINSTVDKA